MTERAPGFLWGASTAPHQIEGNNLNSDFWTSEGRMPGMERSGDACDSYHRYREDMTLLAEAGLDAYRFGIEWARIEPVPGMISRAELAHYRRMIDTAFELGLAPVVTLHHFTSTLWFAQDGGWLGDRAVERFRAYAEAVAPILDGRRVAHGRRRTDPHRRRATGHHRPCRLPRRHHRDRHGGHLPCHSP